MHFCFIHCLLFVEECEHFHVYVLVNVLNRQERVRNRSSARGEKSCEGFDKLPVLSPLDVVPLLVWRLHGLGFVRV